MNPTPVDTSTAPPSRSSATEISVSLVLRSICAVRAIACSAILAAAGGGRLAVHGESLRGRQRGGRRPGDGHDRAPAPEGARAERTAEPRRTARRQHVVGAGGVVAERC